MLIGLDDLKKELETYENSGGFQKTRHFSLKNDGDEATVRIMVSGIKEVDGEPKVDLPIYYVHREDKLGKWGRNIKCTQDEDCPYCRAGDKPRIRLFLPLYLAGDEVPVQIWERGITEIRNLLNMASMYGELNKRDFKIKRNGKARDPKTVYSILPDINSDAEVTLPEMPEIVSPYSFYLLELSKEDMKKALNGQLTEDDLKPKSAEDKEEEDYSDVEGFRVTSNDDIPF